MALDDIKDRIKEQLQGISGRIQETQAWNQLSEQFQNLSPLLQKLVLTLGVLVFALLLLTFPWMFFSSSQTSVADFESKKQLIRELFRVSRAANALPPMSPPMSAMQLRSSVEGTLSSQQPPLTPEQRGGIVDFDNSKSAGSLPKSLTQNGVIVNLSKLNVDQIVRIGQALQSISPTVKMTGVSVAPASAQENHYFNVAFKLVAFNLPVAPPKPIGKGAKPAAKPQSNSEE